MLKKLLVTATATHMFRIVMMSIWVFRTCRTKWIVIFGHECNSTWTTL